MRHPMTVAERLEQELQALRGAGAAQRDPVRWHYIEVLYRRTQAQPEAVHSLLHERLQRALQDLGSTPALTAPPAANGAAGRGPAAPAASAAATPTGAIRSGTAPAAAADRAPSALGRLLQDLQASTPAQQTLAPGTGRRSRLPPENPRVQQFRQQLHSLSVKKQVQQALAQAPQHAGPINSQRLVLRALALMRDIEPDYLQRFMAHVDTLLCLESAQQTRPPMTRKKPSRA